MITVKMINEVLIEARRFDNVARMTEHRLNSDSYAKYGCKETAALKRASMDLSRKLTELRRN